MARRDDDALAAEWHQLMGRYQRLMCALDRELAVHDLSASEFEVPEMATIVRRGINWAARA